MILKIFTKRKKGGEFVENNLHWKSIILEADEILSVPHENKIEFQYLLNGVGKTAVCETDTQGYEILNSSGITIEKYVTA